MTGRLCALPLAVLLHCPAVSVAGGATPPAPVPIDLAAIRQIQSIALPPVILPGGLSSAVVTRETYKQLTLSLALKGYVMHLVDELVLESGVEPARLMELDPDSITALLPEGNTHYLLCWLEEVPGTGANPVRLRTSAALIERPSKRVLWKNFAYSPESDPFAEQMGAFFRALLLDRMSPQRGFYTPVQRQIEFDRRVEQIEGSNRMIIELSSPAANSIRDVLSAFPERPMR
jgi:hypothetical protein